VLLLLLLLLLLPAVSAIPATKNQDHDVFFIHQMHTEILLLLLLGCLILELMKENSTKRIFSKKITPFLLRILSLSLSLLLLQLQETKNSGCQFSNLF
jgi:hypothetical protein